MLAQAVYQGRMKKNGQITAVKVMDLIPVWSHGATCLVSMSSCALGRRGGNQSGNRRAAQILSPSKPHKVFWCLADQGAIRQDTIAHALTHEQDGKQDKLWVAMEMCSGGSITDLAKKLAPKHVPENVSGMPTIGAVDWAAGDCVRPARNPRGDQASARQ